MAAKKPRITEAQCERARRLSASHDRRTVAALTGVSTRTLLALERRGWQPAARRFRPVPKDWGVVAPGQGVVQLAAYYRTSQTVILRWRKEKPVDRPYNGGVAWQPPANFTELLKEHSAAAVGRMLGVNEHTVMTARLRLGIHPRQVAARKTVGWAERYVAEVRA